MQKMFVPLPGFWIEVNS